MSDQRSVFAAAMDEIGTKVVAGKYMVPVVQSF